MKRVLINGVGGQMGHALTASLREQAEEWEIVGGVDPVCHETLPFPVFESVEQIDVKPDVVIDFSVPAATERILEYCTEQHIPIVICTTALPESLIERIEQASKEIPIFRSGNMSLGINLMRKLVRDARAMLGDAFDVEIIEAHHNRKIDAPSGTALMLGEAIRSADCKEHPYVFGRSEKNRRRTPEEIGFHSIRGGTVVGEHEVRFLGTDEELSVLHRATSKRVFATGAIKAAEFLLRHPCGLYSMDDLVKELLNK